MYDPTVAYKIEDEKSRIPEEVHNQVSELSLYNPVRNLGFDYLFFTDSSVFRPAANAFEENERNGNPCYTTAIPGTTQYRRFWEKELDRCINGYTVGGVRITGEHYFYLNYGRIEKRTERKDGTITKTEEFPDFLSMDYYWFLTLERAENPVKYGRSHMDKRGIIMAKARRKGWSFKNAAGAAWIYTFFEKSRVVIASELEEKALNTFSMFKTMLNHLNKYTEFRHPTLKDTQTFIRSGWIETKNGQDVEEGYKSEVFILTLKDKPDKAAGLSCTRLIFEEAGLIHHLKKAFRFAEPTMRDGKYWVGIPIVFGTGGDMEGATQDFSEMFLDPQPFNLERYDNIYELHEMQTKCGYFVDEMWYRPGCSYVDEKGEIHWSVDDNGNANRWVAELDLDEERVNALGSSKTDYDVLITQKCKTPSEAFLTPEGNVFPVAELKAIELRLRKNDRYKKIGTPGILEWGREDTRPVVFKPRPDLTPNYYYPFKQSVKAEGAVVIYQSPPEEQYPSSLYKIGYDPVKFDIVNGKSVFKSLASIYVYKSLQKFEYGYDEIVAEYTGRYEDTDQINEIALKLSLYYGNAKIMHENEIGKDVISYFKRKGKLHLLEHQPDSAIGRVIRNSKVTRPYGSPMNDKMKAACEKWALNWMWTERGHNEDGEKVYNMDLIPSLGLIQELKAYNRDGNFDRVMAFFQLMLVVEEYKEVEVAKTETNPIAKQLLERHARK